MSGKAFVDTNLLVYAFDAADPDKQERAQHVLATAEPGELTVSVQVLNEFYVAVTRKLAEPLATELAAQVVRELARLEVVAVDTGLVLAAIDRSRSVQVSLWDALVLEAALHAGCQQLLTEDLNAGQDVDGLTIVNPFH